MNENKCSIVGALATWGLTIWTWYEAHTAAIVGIFAILASVATIYAALRRKRRRTLYDDQPTTTT